MTRLQPKATRLLTAASSILVVMMAIWVVYFSFDSVLPQRQHANIVFGVGLAAYYFRHATELSAAENDSVLMRLNAIVCVLLGIVTLAAAAYVHSSYFRWLDQGRLLMYTDVDLLVGVAVMYVATDVTFRKYGVVLGTVVVGTMLYGVFGQHFPGILSHSGLAVEDLIRRQTITLNGVYGFLLQIGATWIAIFIVFAGLIEGYGGFDYLVEIGNRIKQYSRSGIAQSAVITSMFMGTMMGSAASNVATTGSFTIPFMEEHGVPPRFAAATEAVASTGGQILPPIMGTAAFLMADILGVPFADIAVAGVIPALLFYVGTSLGVHFTIIGRGWYDKEAMETNPETTVQGPSPVDPEASPVSNGSRGSFYIRGLQYVLPVVVLIYTLVIVGFGPLSAGLYTISTAVLARGVRQVLDGELRAFVGETVQGLRIGGENLAPFLALLASLGMVINIFSVTGLAQRLAFELLDLSGGSFVLILLITMVVSLLLGLGMPTPAAYILVATLLAPGLVQIGITEIAAHFYIFYFALLSALTPPVALAVTVAMSISETDFVETAREALILGAPTFVIPFMFVTNPNLLEWDFYATAIMAVFFLISIIALVVSLTGFVGERRLSKWTRLFCMILFVAIGFGATVSIQVVATVLLGATMTYASGISFTDMAKRTIS